MRIHAFVEVAGVEPASKQEPSFLRLAALILLRALAGGNPTQSRSLNFAHRRDGSFIP